MLGGSGWTLGKDKNHEEGGTALGKGDAQRDGEISICGGFKVFARENHG